MRIQTDPPLHLTYCLNVHPGESWAENLAAIAGEALKVRNLLAPPGCFALGLRLSARAAGQLRRQRALAELKQFLAGEKLYVFTINGFPYGRFHGRAVKGDVYRPDWRSRQRLDYTIMLADILAELLPEGMIGSISTVPCSYAAWIRSRQDVRAMVRMLCEAAFHLAQIRRRRGKEIVLALEPEPDCYLARTEQTVAFFAGPLAEIGGMYLRDERGLGASDASETIQRHVGVCFDTSHLAVEFEDLTAGLESLARAGIRVGKIHLSSALRARPTAEAREQLKEFCDPVYLHQVKARTADGKIVSYADLPEALNAPASADDDEWRVHFHVPLFFEKSGHLQSTGSLLKGSFAAALKAGGAEHLEIETYTFGVLPAPLRKGGVSSCIAREYQWVLRNMFPRAVREKN